MSQSPFTVVGAGLGGALMACYLGRAGHRVTVLERRTDPRVAGATAGRSINLAVSTRAIHAFREVGVVDEVMANAVPMRGRVVHSPQGDLAFQPYGTRDDQAINSVSRGGLNIALIDAAERIDGVHFEFDSPVSDLDIETGRVTIGQGPAARETDAAVVIGADGAYSAVRGRMQRLDRFEYSQSYLAHGYKELTIPPAEGGGFRMEPNALHIWPRGGYMMIALPNPDGSFTCTLFWPFTGPHGLESLQSHAAVEQFFGIHFPDAVPLMPTLADDYLGNMNSSLVTIRCSPWSVGGRVALIGDACHAVVPFYGQGANAAFEDCSVLNACLAKHADNIEAAFDEYDRRKVDTDALADLAIRNFLEMRDHVASPWFRARKRWEKRIHLLFPMWYIPLYSMVTFSRMPYAAAIRRAARQDRVVVGALGLLVVLLVLVVALWR